MEKTFYGVLGVAADAEQKRIRRAYRSLVKEYHPDVSDDPEAPERFKRLTVARDVLLDDTERERYDRLGHDAYVHRHVDSVVWERDQSDAAPVDPEPRTGETDHTTETVTGGATTGVGANRVGWLGETERHGETGSTAGGAGRQHDGHAAASPRDGRAWQQASRMYSRAGSQPGRQSSPVGRVAGGIRTLGPWLPIHVVLILSALATGWFTFSQADRLFELPVSAVVFGSLLIGLVVLLSVLHMISELYT